MIGTSLSKCVQDILLGRVKEEDVELIVASTKIRDGMDKCAVLTEYGEVFWRADPAEGKAIAERLFAAGKIDQPRLRDEPFAGVQEGNTFWVKSKEDLKYDCFYFGW